MKITRLNVGDGDGDGDWDWWKKEHMLGWEWEVSVSPHNITNTYTTQRDRALKSDYRKCIIHKYIHTRFSLHFK